MRPVPKSFRAKLPHATQVSIAKALDAGSCDLLVTVGGSGVGRSDATIAALAARGEVIAHGLALQPGRTTAVGGIGKIPVIALPGAPDHALAAFWTLALPALDRLSGRQPRRRSRCRCSARLPPAAASPRSSCSQRNDGSWMPLAVGDLSLETIARSDAWLAVPGGSEGFAAGTPVDAYMLRN